MVVIELLIISFVIYVYFVIYSINWWLPLAVLGHRLHHLHVVKGRVMKDGAGNKTFQNSRPEFFIFTMLILVKGRRWQWVPNCPISRIVAFVEKVCNLWPNRRMGRWHRHTGRGEGDSCFSPTGSNRPSPTLLLWCTNQEQCKEGICWKNQANRHSFEPGPKSGQWKSALKGWKGTGRKTAAIVHEEWVTTVEAC